MTTAIQNPAASIDADVLTLAIYDFLAAKKRPVTIDQVELRLFGLSGDWLSRKLVDQFRKHGTFPIVERYLARWRSAARTCERRRLEEIIERGVATGLWKTTPGPRGACVALGATSAGSLESLIRKFTAPSINSAREQASDPTPPSHGVPFHPAR